MRRGTRSKRDTVILKALDADRNIVEQHEWSIEEYYDGTHDIIDSDEYRAAKGIRWIEGQILDSSGKAAQEFWNRYSRTGRYESGKAVHADGTVTED